MNPVDILAAIRYLDPEPAPEPQPEPDDSAIHLASWQECARAMRRQVVDLEAHCVELDREIAELQGRNLELVERALELAEHRVTLIYCLLVSGLVALGAVAELLWRLR